MDRSPQHPVTPLTFLPLILLADLATAARRTLLTGTASLLDSLVLLPGLHAQHTHLATLPGNEHPACAALTTGYVFRVENPATVFFLLSVGEEGSLVTLSVSSVASVPSPPPFTSSSKTTREETDHDDDDKHTNQAGAPLAPRAPAAKQNYPAEQLYRLPAALTLLVLLRLAAQRDGHAVLGLALLVLARLANAVVLRRRVRGSRDDHNGPTPRRPAETTKPPAAAAAPPTPWKGAAEPGEPGDLLILLSQDRWVRLRGAVDDLKAVTAGAWLREARGGERGVVAAAKLGAWAAVGVLCCASAEGRGLVVGLGVVSLVVVGVVNGWNARELKIFGRRVAVVGRPRRYARRRDLADELIAETGRDDWAVRLGMIVKEGAVGEGPKTM